MVVYFERAKTQTNPKPQPHNPTMPNNESPSFAELLKTQTVHVLGVSGKLASGKTTLCDGLVARAESGCDCKLHNRFGGRTDFVLVRNFGDELKEYVAETYGITLSKFYQRDGKNTEVDTSDYGRVTIGRLLQLVGQGKRESDGADFWVEQLSRWIRSQHDCVVVIGDVRYVNEAQFVTQVCGGKVIRLHGDPSGTHASTTRDTKHESETGLDGKIEFFFRLIGTNQHDKQETQKMVWKCISEMMG